MKTQHQFTYTLIVDGRVIATYHRMPPKDIRGLANLKGITLTKYDNKRECEVKWRK